MEEIFDTNHHFDFSKLVLTKPTTISGGNYFIRIMMKNQYLYIQPPKCHTKQGIQKNGKRFYTDLVFTNENEDFIQWIENLDKYCQQSIFQNRQSWFDGDMEEQDIEDYFTPILKVYKSGKQYVIRINMKTNLNTNKPALKIYDEDENDIDFESLDDKTNIMTILEVKGIKFSAKSFQFEIEMKQLMVIKPKNLFDKCLLKPKATNDVIVSIEKPVSSEIEQPIEVEAATPPLIDIPTSIPLVETNESLENILLVREPEIETIKKIVDGMEEIEIDLEEIKNNETVQLKQRNDVYYQLYKEAKKKAKVARDFALSAYLEAKEIKNKYMLDDLKDSDDSDLDVELETDDFETDK